MIDPHNQAALRKLWENIFVMAVRDAMGFNVASTSRRNETRAARAWLGTKHFYMICAMCNRDGDKELKAIREKIAKVDAGELTARDLGLSSGRRSGGYRKSAATAGK